MCYNKEAKTFLPIVGLVVIAGIVFFYWTIPGIGDTFRPQPELAGSHPVRHWDQDRDRR